MLIIQEIYNNATMKLHVNGASTVARFLGVRKVTQYLIHTKLWENDTNVMRAAQFHCRKYAVFIHQISP